MATQLLPPGVSVIQEFRTISPTIVVPTLVPCAVGPAFEIIEATTLDATGNSVTNTQAVVSVPASVRSAIAGPYSGLNGLTLKVSLNNGAAQTFTFSDPTSLTLTAGQVKDQISATVPAPAGFSAYVVTMGASEYVQLRSTASGDGQTVQILDGTANTILGFSNNFIGEGITTYKQDAVHIDQANFPDPNGIADEVDIDEDSIRVFLNTGKVLQEVKRDTSFLRNKKHAVYTSGVITFPTTTLTSKKFSYKDGLKGATKEYTFTGEMTTAAALANAMNGLIGGITTIAGGTYSTTENGLAIKMVVNGAAITCTFSGANPLAVASAVAEINAAAGHTVAHVNSGKIDWYFTGGSLTLTYTASTAWAGLGLTGTADLVQAVGSTKVSVNALAPSTTIDYTTTEGYFEVLTPSASSAHAIIKWTDGATGTTLEVVDDGDGDLTSPIVICDLDDFMLAAGSASLTGSASLATPVNVHNKTFQVARDGATQQEVIFDGGPIVPGAVFDASNTLNTNLLYLTVYGAAKTCTFSGSDPIGIASAISQINAAAGLTVAYRSTVAGVADPAGLYISYQVGGATKTDGGSVSLTYASSSAWTNLGLLGTADFEQTNTIAEIITQVNATLGSGFASGSTYLALTSTTIGAESKVEIGNGTANTLLGFTLAQVDYGDFQPPKAGDSVYADGALVGNIAVVAPGGVKTRLKLDREVALTFIGTAVYIQANAIASTLPADRPTPDLVIDTSGAVLVKADIFRDTEGNPSVSTGQILVAFNALRLDVTSSAAEPALLTFDDTNVLGTALHPINADNPLALMFYYMLINSPGVSVSGLGVDATSALNPDGTPEAYARALSYLEAQEVYALAPASQDPLVHQSFMTHVTAMSEPDAKGERIVFICPPMPDEDLPALATSGTDGDSGSVANTFNTKLASLAADVQAAGVDPVGTIDATDGLYLTVATNSYKYNISAITSTYLTIRVAFAAGENDDSFYATTNLPTTLISETFTVYVRGTPLVTVTGAPDYDRIAEAYQKTGEVYGNRRVYMIAPETVNATIDGAEQALPGYYLCAALAGMVGQLAPQQGFTNMPIAGFTRVKGSNDVFSRTQMNVGAAGGTWWVVQETAGAPLSTRHQLSTDLTSIETRELSITKVIDFCAKFMRSGLRNFIGRFNITQPFLDGLSTVVQGQLSFLTESGIIISGDLNNIVQDTSAPDTVLIDVTLSPPYPCNYLRLTLVI